MVDHDNSKKTAEQRRARFERGIVWATSRWNEWQRADRAKWKAGPGLGTYAESAAAQIPAKDVWRYSVDNQLQRPII